MHLRCWNRFCADREITTLQNLNNLFGTVLQFICKSQPHFVGQLFWQQKTEKTVGKVTEESIKSIFNAVAMNCKEGAEIWFGKIWLVFVKKFRFCGISLAAPLAHTSTRTHSSTGGHSVPYPWLTIYDSISMILEFLTVSTVEGRVRHLGYQIKFY